MSGLAGSKASQPAPGQLRRFSTDDSEFRWSGMFFIVLGDRSTEFDSHYVSLYEIILGDRIELVTQHMIESCSSVIS